MDDTHFWIEGFLNSELDHSTPVTSQIAEQVEESVKRGIETSIPGLIEETLRKELQASIPALVEGEIKKQLQAIPRLVEEAVKNQFGASIPQLVLVLQRSLAPPLTSRSSPQQAYESNSRIFHLNFVGNLPKELFTKDKIKDQGASLTVELHDQFRHRVDVGPESSAKIKIFVVNGDFKVEDGLEEEDISKQVVLPREGKPPLLKGKYENISLINGVANIGGIAFTDNSTPMRNKKFRLAAQVVNGDSLGVAIKGAVSGEVQVKEYRNTFNRKQGTLSPDDEVWHLVNIGRGEIHNKLKVIGVCSVKDLLQRYDNDPKALLQIFRGNKKKLKKTVEIAKSRSQPGQPIQPQEITMQAEDVCIPITSANMHLNDVGADQVAGMMPYQPVEATFKLPDYCTPSLTFEDCLNDLETKCCRPRWHLVRAILRFKNAAKVSVKEGPSAGKRQKCG